MADRLIKSETLQDIADALRERTEKTEKINPSKFADEIRTLETSEPYDDSVTVIDGEVVFMDDYAEGRNDVYAIVDPLNAELEQTLYGTDTGGKSYYDEFWDNVLAVGSWQFLFGGRAWTAKTFRPPFNLVLEGNCNYCFYGSGLNVDFPDFLTELAIRMNTTAMTSANSMFSNGRFTVIGEVDFSNCEIVNSTFSYCGYLRTIVKIIVHENLKFSSAFNSCQVLNHMIVEGTIGQNGFDVKWSPLDKESLTSIVNALSTTTSGMTVTLSLNAVNKAFETSEGANDGRTSAEWLALAGTRSNWTISLATV